MINTLFPQRQIVSVPGCLSSTGENPEGAEGAKGAGGPGLPTHLSQHHREALLVHPEVQML